MAPAYCEIPFFRAFKIWHRAMSPLFQPAQLAISVINLPPRWRGAPTPTPLGRRPIERAARVWLNLGLQWDPREPLPVNLSGPSDNVYERLQWPLGPDSNKLHFAANNPCLQWALEFRPKLGAQPRYVERGSCQGCCSPSRRASGRASRRAAAPEHVRHLSTVKEETAAASGLAPAELWPTSFSVRKFAPRY